MYNPKESVGFWGSLIIATQWLIEGHELFTILWMVIAITQLIKFKK